MKTAHCYDRKEESGLQRSKTKHTADAFVSLIRLRLNNTGM